MLKTLFKSKTTNPKKVDPPIELQNRATETHSKTTEPRKQFIRLDEAVVAFLWYIHLKHPNGTGLSVKDLWTEYEQNVSNPRRWHAIGRSPFLKHLAIQPGVVRKRGVRTKQGGRSVKTTVYYLPARQEPTIVYSGGANVQR